MRHTKGGANSFRKIEVNNPYKRKKNQSNLVYLRPYFHCSHFWERFDLLLTLIRLAFSHYWTQNKAILINSSWWKPTKIEVDLKKHFSCLKLFGSIEALKHWVQERIIKGWGVVEYFYIKMYCRLSCTERAWLKFRMCLWTLDRHTYQEQTCSSLYVICKIPLALHKYFSLDATFFLLLISYPFPIWHNSTFHQWCWPNNFEGVVEA